MRSSQHRPRPPNSDMSELYPAAACWDDDVHVTFNSTGQVQHVHGAKALDIVKTLAAAIHPLNRSLFWQRTPQHLMLDGSYISRYLVSNNNSLFHSNSNTATTTTTLVYLCN